MEVESHRFLSVHQQQQPNNYRVVMKILFIIPPSFCPPRLLDFMRIKFEKAGYKVIIITYKPASNLGSLEKRACDVLSQIPQGTTGAYIVGISSGGVIAKMLADMCPKGTFSKIMLYGTPMLMQSPFLPVWGTLWHYFKKGHLFKAIVGYGVGHMTQREAEDFLFGGFSDAFATEATEVGESWGIIRQMIFGKLPTNDSQDIEYIVIGVDMEKFHRWSGSRRWAKRSVNTTYALIAGSHFGALTKSHSLDKLVGLLN